MEELIQVLTTAKELVAILQAKKQSLDQREASVAAQAKRLDEIEQVLNEKARAITEKQTAETMLLEAKAIRNEAVRIKEQADQAMAQLDNMAQEQTRKIEAARAEAQKVADQADQVRMDKAALQEEKATYKAKVLKEIQDNLKVGKIG